MIYALMPTLFRILNFGIIVSLVVYVYRRYGRQALQDMFMSYEENQRLLSAEVVALEKRVRAQKQAFSNQQDLADRLSRNIEQWKESVAHAILLRQQEKESITLSLQKKSEQVARYTSWVFMRRECLVAAHREAVEVLTDFYADPAHAQAYLQKTLSSLKEQS